MSGCSALAPTAHRGQTSQTGTEEENGAGLGDGGPVPIERDMRNGTTIGIEILEF